jgi:hypothetical protein
MRDWEWVLAHLRGCVGFQSHVYSFGICVQWVPCRVPSYSALLRSRVTDVPSCIRWYHIAENAVWNRASTVVDSNVYKRSVRCHPVVGIQLFDEQCCRFTIIACEDGCRICRAGDKADVLTVLALVPGLVW